MHVRRLRYWRRVPRTDVLSFEPNLLFSGKRLEDPGLLSNVALLRCMQSLEETTNVEGSEDFGVIIRPHSGLREPELRLR
jgi:hypothetical protein